MRRGCLDISSSFTVSIYARLTVGIYVRCRYLHAKKSWPNCSATRTAMFCVTRIFSPTRNACWRRASRTAAKASSQSTSILHIVLVAATGLRSIAGLTPVRTRFIVGPCRQADAARRKLPDRMGGGLLIRQAVDRPLLAAGKARAGRTGRKDLAVMQASRESWERAQPSQ